jgi:signal transduction histidine kinase
MRRRSDGAPPGARAGEREQIRRAFLGLALCHELKQPLHSLNLNLELLSKRLAKVESNADVGGPVAALGRVCDRINDCLDAYAARTVPEGAVIDGVDVIAILKEAILRAQDRATSARVTLSLRSGDLPTLSVNPEQLAVALDALLDNAIRASAPGGEVLLSGSWADEDVRLEITDQGQGMTPEVSHRAVEIGFSTWGGGGIGMTVAKFIAYHHAGGFQVTSKPGHGTTIALLLPASDLRE